MAATTPKLTGFENFRAERISCGEVTLFVRHNSAPEKPALLLLHGYPQTSAMWHKVVPHFEADYHVICPDLRGYGQSDKPDGGADHRGYSKRSMAADMVALLDHFGHRTTRILAHDRGARVAHRLGLDHDSRVQAMTILDIAPTREMYANTTDGFARAYWHWFFLITPHPLPERAIEGDPRGYWMRKCLKQTRGEHPWAPAALEEYLSAFENPAMIRATCEDYRAAATIDIAHDDADQGRKLQTPLLVLWAKRGAIEAHFDALALWRSRAEDVSGQALDGTHYLAEEIPEEISSLTQTFFGRV